MAALAATALLSWSLGVLMHWWPRLGASTRRRAAIAVMVAGVGFLVAALRSEGLREATIPSIVIVGRASHVETASASASLYYYVLTAVCLLLGFTGLALGEPLARWMAPRFLASSVAVAWTVTLMRFLLEKSAAPSLLTQSVGVTWIAPVAGAYLATCLRGQAGTSWRALLRTLVAYAFLVRGFVALVGVVATRLALGTHYDVSGVTAVTVALTGASREFAPGEPAQTLWLTLLPQLVAWPPLTVVGGLAGALVARLLPPAGRRLPASGAHALGAVE